MTSSAHKAMMDWSNKEDYKRGIQHIWQDNAVKNIAYFDAHPEKMVGSIYKMPKYDGKAVIFVGRGKSLDKAIEMFKDADDRFIIVCTNSSIRYLLENGVVPHYMILIDGEKGSWTFENLPAGAEKVTAIFAAGACHEEVVKWPGKIMVVPYGVKKGSVQKDIRKRWGKSIAAGGNALNGAVAVFITTTNIKVYIFVGNNLSFKEGESFYFNQPTERDDKAYFIMHDIYGEEVLTDMPMYQYKIWLEQTCNAYFPDCVFINASEGVLGVDVDNQLMGIFQYMPLDEAIKRTKEAFDFENLDPIERSRVFYQMMYDDENYSPINGGRQWEVIADAYKDGRLKIVKALDVGCGTGEGIRKAVDAGIDAYGADISDNTVLWRENGVEGRCIQAPGHAMPYKDREFDFIYCGDVMEHIPEDYLIPTLKEIYRVGSDTFLFCIALGLEKAPIYTTTAVYTHISLKPATEWEKMMRDIGYNVYSVKGADDGGHVVIQANRGSR